MPNLEQRLQEEILEDGKISDYEVNVIRDYVHHDGHLNSDDVRFLVELLCQATEVTPAFDELFFAALKRIILEDGKIGANEQFYLLKMLYSDGEVRPSELEFLRELRSEAQEVTPEFEELCQTAFAADPLQWDVGGTAAH